MKKSEKAGLKLFGKQCITCDTLNAYDAFVKGYEKAEKENKLNYSDIKRIVQLYEKVAGGRIIDNDEIYKKILKLFKNEKN